MTSGAPRHQGGQSGCLVMHGASCGDFLLQISRAASVSFTQNFFGTSCYLFLCYYNPQTTHNPIRKVTYHLIFRAVYFTSIFPGTMGSRLNRPSAEDGAEVKRPPGPTRTIRRKAWRNLPHSNHSPVPRNETPLCSDPAAWNWPGILSSCRFLWNAKANQYELRAEN